MFSQGSPCEGGLAGQLSTGGRPPSTGQLMPPPHPPEPPVPPSAPPEEPPEPPEPAEPPPPSCLPPQPLAMRRTAEMPRTAWATSLMGRTSAFPSASLVPDEAPWFHAHTRGQRCGGLCQWRQRGQPSQATTAIPQ